MANNRIRFLIALLGICLIVVALNRPGWSLVLTGALLGVSVNAVLYSRMDMKWRWKMFFVRQGNKAKEHA